MTTTRLATVNDKLAVLGLLDELLSFIDETNHGTHTPVQTVGSPLYETVMRDNSLQIFLAEDHGQAVGLMTFFVYPVIRRGHYRGQIEDVFVTKTMRGKGVGSKLLEAVKAYCHDYGISSVRLNSGLLLTEAHAFYEKNGGKFTERMYRFDIE